MGIRRVALVVVLLLALAAGVFLYVRFLPGSASPNVSPVPQKIVTPQDRAKALESLNGTSSVPVPQAEVEARAKALEQPTSSSSNPGPSAADRAKALESLH